MSGDARTQPRRIFAALITCARSACAGGRRADPPAPAPEGISCSPSTRCEPITWVATVTLPHSPRSMALIRQDRVRSGDLPCAFDFVFARFDPRSLLPQHHAASFARWRAPPAALTLARSEGSCYHTLVNEGGQLARSSAGSRVRESAAIEPRFRAGPLRCRLVARSARASRTRATAVLPIPAHVCPHAGYSPEPRHLPHSRRLTTPAAGRTDRSCSTGQPAELPSHTADERHVVAPTRQIRTAEELLIGFVRAPQLGPTQERDRGHFGPRRRSGGARTFGVQPHALRRAAQGPARVSSRAGCRGEENPGRRGNRLWRARFLARRDAPPSDVEDATCCRNAAGRGRPSASFGSIPSRRGAQRRSAPRLEAGRARITTWRAIRRDARRGCRRADVVASLARLRDTILGAASAPSQVVRPPRARGSAPPLGYIE